MVLKNGLTWLILKSFLTVTILQTRLIYWNLTQICKEQCESSRYNLQTQPNFKHFQSVKLSIAYPGLYHNKYGSESSDKFKRVAIKSCKNCRGHFYIDFTRFLAFDAKRGGWVGLELSVDMTLRFAKIDM